MKAADLRPSTLTRRNKNHDQPQNDTVTYNYTLNQNWGKPAQPVCLRAVGHHPKLSSFRVRYQRRGGVTHVLRGGCYSALADDRPLGALAANATSTVMAVGWTGGNIGTALAAPALASRSMSRF